MHPSLRTRLRWRLQELRDPDDAKVIGGLLLIVALTFGGFLAARMVARASVDPQAATRIVTLRQKVRVREHGHVVAHWRVRRLYSQAQTVMQTQTIRTPNGTRLVIRYRVVYRKHLVTVPGETRTVTHQVTDSVTRQVTVVRTTTVVSTKTDTLPITITLTVP